MIFSKQMLERMWRKGNPSALLVGMQTGAATVENSMEFPWLFFFFFKFIHFRERRRGKERERDREGERETLM